VSHVGLAFDLCLLNPRAFGGAISAFEALRRVAIHLDQHGVINVRAESAFDGFEMMATDFMFSCALLLRRRLQELQELVHCHVGRSNQGAERTHGQFLVLRDGEISPLASLVNTRWLPTWPIASQPALPNAFAASLPEMLPSLPIRIRPSKVEMLQWQAVKIAIQNTRQPRRSEFAAPASHGRPSGLRPTSRQ